jgi:hypothetical protein
MNSTSGKLSVDMPEIVTLTVANFAKQFLPGDRGDPN